MIEKSSSQSMFFESIKTYGIVCVKITKNSMRGVTERTTVER
jgi:hypothetical protein